MFVNLLCFKLEGRMVREAFGAIMELGGQEFVYVCSSCCAKPKKMGETNESLKSKSVALVIRILVCVCLCMCVNERGWRKENCWNYFYAWVIVWAHVLKGGYIWQILVIPTFCFSPVSSLLCVCMCVCVCKQTMNFKCELFWHNQFHINSFHSMPVYNIWEERTDWAKCRCCQIYWSTGLPFIQAVFMCMVV